MKDTPGLESVEVVGMPAPGWKCDEIEEYLADLRYRAWLRWCQQIWSIKGSYSSDPAPKKVMEGGLKDRVVLEFVICPNPALPSEFLEDCDAARPGPVVRQSSGRESFDSAAMQALLTSGVGRLPENCKRNRYRIRMTFESIPLDRVELERRVLVALSHGKSGLRVLAAQTLGDIGGESDETDAALRRLAKDDPVDAVRVAAREALEKLGKR